MSFNYRRYGSLVGSTAGLLNKTGVFNTQRAFFNPENREVVVTSQTTDLGVLAGGTSQSNVSGFTETVTLTATGYTSGKRLIIALFGFRDANGSYGNSRVPLTSAVSLGGTSLTILAEGQSDFNNSCIAAGLVNLTGSQTFSVTFTGTIATGGAGYLSYIVFDDVSYWEYIADSSGTNTSTSTLSIPGTAGAPSTTGQTIRIVGLNGSNPATAPTFTPSDGFSYTSWFSQDNGTTEFSVGYYFIDSSISGQQNAISGSMGGATAGNGMGWAVADFKVYK